jgi:hypothetical protein
MQCEPDVVYNLQSFNLVHMALLPLTTPPLSSGHS